MNRNGMVAMDNKELTAYLTGAAGRLVKTIGKATLGNPRETALLLNYSAASKTAAKRRATQETAGRHIPLFLIASIADSCNLFCSGCYARANGGCGGNKSDRLLSPEKWGDLFRQAGEAGVSFCLLAGGEPLLRREVLEEAAKVEGILFPVFTNGTLIDASYLPLFDRHRNLIPILSMEGGESSTDQRRGKGTYHKLLATMELLHRSKLLFGVSITVTTENIEEVTSQAFIELLIQNGCKGVLFVEYVPVDRKTEQLAPTEKERALLEKRQETLRIAYDTMLFLSFPGDEKYMGGCLAAGRGFFHINPYGGAEPCPFSPYSDLSLTDHTLLEALDSPLFQKANSLSYEEHAGGCTLFANESKVQAFLQATK